MLYNYLAYFFIYGFLGWCVEVVFKALQKGVWQNRGFLNGAICPIYGFGLCAVLLILEPYKDNLWILYFGSVLVTSALELVTGFLMDKIFHKRWWDYSRMPLNINGYVCLLFSLVWGVACVIFVRFIHPVTARLVSLVPHVVGLVALAGLLAAFVTDTVLTVLTVLKLNRKLRQIDEMSAKLKEQSDRISKVLFNNAIKAEEFTTEQIDDLKQKYQQGKDKYEQLLEKNNARREEIEEYRREKENLLKLRLAQEKNKLLSFGQRRLLKAFPDVKTTDFPKSLEEVKKSLARLAAGKGKKGQEKD